mgnify:FL=1
MEFNATFIVSAISFIIFVVLMNIILYTPLQNIVEERKRTVDNNYNEANANSEKSTALIKDRADKILKAGQDAKSVINAKSNDANLKRDEITQSAKDEAQQNLEANRVYFTNATQEAKEVLKSDVVGLAQSISDKFLGSDEKIIGVDNELIEKIMQG